MPMMPSAAALAQHAIGVFDSGVGGLSVLRALQAELAQESWVYVADSGHAPYGERNDEHVLQRSHGVADYLIRQHHIKALVVACNTATASAIKQLRAAYPALPIIGIEPALKPAAALSKTGVVGVMATRGTLNSAKFRALLDTLHGQATFVLQPCDGLADAIEHDDVPRIAALCAEYTSAMGRFGPAPGAMDTLVLGCTHYPFVADLLRQHTGADVQQLEGGAPVARQTRRVLAQAALLGQATLQAQAPMGQPANTLYFSTGQPQGLQTVAERWLGQGIRAQALHI